ncbi:MAG TPA: pyridoxamine 5'-phosphate oxidase family protein [Pseudonocardiaceae bacterium]|jgi:hypothetical protein|nr:pyridoxamine 5'-phosphate oxidase family protein [Pseudonocardiaceae bacterium]
MTWWDEFAVAEPEFAQRVRDRFSIRKHCTMATVRKNGAPRISGTEVEFSDGGLFIGSMSGALKALDLRRDSRLALHSPTEDAPEEDQTSWAGEAKISGLAHEVGDPSKVEESHRFRIEVTEVVLTRVGGPDHLLIETWRPGKGLESRRRY